MMMNNKKSALRKLAKYLSVLPLLLLLIIANSVYAQTNETQKESTNPLVVIDSVKMEKGFDVNKMKGEDIASLRIYKGEDAVSRYGSEAKYGIVEIRTKKTSKNEDGIDFITSIDKKAEFPGEFEAFINYLNDNVRYPTGALKDAIEGKVIASFDVNKDGSISDIAIVRSLHPLLDEEAIRVLIDMPNWNPTIKDGKPIKMKVIWPVDFSLNYLDRYKY